MIFQSMISYMGSSLKLSGVVAFLRSQCWMKLRLSILINRQDLWKLMRGVSK